MSSRPVSGPLIYALWPIVRGALSHVAGELVLVGWLGWYLYSPAPPPLLLLAAHETFETLIVSVTSVTPVTIVSVTSVTSMLYNLEHRHWDSPVAQITGVYHTAGTVLLLDCTG